MPPAPPIQEGLKYQIESLDQIENTVVGLRTAWEMGLGPIENLTEILESKKIKISMIKLEGGGDFDALTCWFENRIPVIAVKKDIPGDRQRFNLSHELGHILLDPLGNVDPEKAAHRFAGAFLVPEPAAHIELGERRHRLDLYELHLLKHKYGLSMQGWIYRAKDLGILPDSEALRLFKTFRRKGWHLQEPGDEYPGEKPNRMYRLVMRALAEDIISESRASELLGMPLKLFQEREAKRHEGFPVGMRG
jgi:Zn-dependent peptidase ImmA (M78 family)